MDEAVHFGHHDVVTILRDYHNQYSPQDSGAKKESAENNLDGMLWRDSAHPNLKVCRKVCRGTDPPDPTEKEPFPFFSVDSVSASAERFLLSSTHGGGMYPPPHWDI